MGRNALSKLILLGAVIFTSLAPLLASTSANPRRAVRRIQIWTFASVFVWAFACRTIYPGLVHVE